MLHVSCCTFVLLREFALFFVVVACCRGNMFITKANAKEDPAESIGLSILSRFLGRGCDEALISEKKGFFQ